MWCSSKYFNTPMCAWPSAPPPSSATPTVSLPFGGTFARVSGVGGVGGLNGLSWARTRWLQRTADKSARKLLRIVRSLRNIGNCAVGFSLSQQATADKGQRTSEARGFSVLCHVRGAGPDRISLNSPGKGSLTAKKL